MQLTSNTMPGINKLYLAAFLTVFAGKPCAHAQDLGSSLASVGLAIQAGSSSKNMNRTQPGSRIATAHKNGSILLETEVQTNQFFGSFSAGPRIRASKNERPSYGAVTRYQFMFSPRQILVPSIGYSADWIDGIRDLAPIFSHGPVLGLTFLLNPLDKVRSRVINSEFGVGRSSIVLQVHAPQTKEPVDTPPIISHIGLRLEW